MGAVETLRGPRDRSRTARGSAGPPSRRPARLPSLPRASAHRPDGMPHPNVRLRVDAEVPLKIHLDGLKCTLDHVRTTLGETHTRPPPHSEMVPVMTMDSGATSTNRAP